MKLFVILLCVCGPAWGQGCPPSPDHGSALAALLAQIQNAPDEASAHTVANELWTLWADAPDEISQEMLDRGMRRRAAWNLLGAREDFDALVAYCPDYAEGYNQRAFVNFLRQDFQAALPDLEHAIELSPAHVAALSGRALTLIGLGREAEAQDALALALELNPWLPERNLLVPPTVPADQPGKDL